MKTQRDTFWDTIFELAKKDRDIIVISADMGAPSLDRFRTELPNQFINTGIAEQNTILVGSGLAKEGKKVFVYAIASFLTLNCVEKIRVQNAMMNIPLNIVGVGAGFSYPDSGPTHHLLEDIAVMRSMPNIDTLSITDATMAKAVAENYQSYNNTKYIRLERQPLGEIYQDSSSISFEDGMHEVFSGEDTLVIANGVMLLKAHKLIKENKLKCGLLDIYKIPINNQKLSEIAKKYSKIVTIEETFLPGGFGSAVLESLNDLGIQMPVERIGLPIEKGFCYEYGGRDEILKYYGITEESILSTIS
jgi:transketolase